MKRIGRTIMNAKAPAVKTGEEVRVDHTKYLPRVDDK